jgi:hypothetical protein
MNAAARSGPAQGRFVRQAVDVNVSSMAINGAALIKARLEALQPENAMRNGRSWVALPRIANRFPAFEDGADGLTGPDLLCDPMQSQRCSIRT